MKGQCVVVALLVSACGLATVLPGDSQKLPLAFSIDAYPERVVSTPIEISGTRPAGSAIYVHSHEKVAASSEPEWRLSLDLVEGTNIFVIRALDAGHNEVGSGTITIVLDSTPPAIVGRSPGAGTTDVAVHTDIRVVFDEPIDCDTVSSESFSLSGTSGALGCAVTTVTLAPDADLAGQTTYTVTVSTAITDLAGNHLATDDQWSFSTVVTQQVDAPTVDPVTTPTSVGNQVLTGTKEAGTSIWIDGQQMVPRSAATTWSALIRLAAGDQIYAVTAKDGNVESSATTVHIEYVSKGAVSGGNLQIDFELADLYSLIPKEFNYDVAQANHYGVDIWVEGPFTYTGSGPPTIEPCRFDDQTHQRQHTRLVAGILRTGPSACLSQNPAYRCWFWGDPDYFSPNHLAALIEADIWADATSPLDRFTDRRDASGHTWAWDQAPTGAGGCNTHLYYHDQWCRIRMQQGPDVDGLTEASKRVGVYYSYTWDLRDRNGAWVEKGPYLLSIAITLDRDPAVAELSDAETCWDNPEHDSRGTHRAEGVVMIDGVTPYSGSWPEKGFIDTVGSATPVSYLLGDVSVTYTP